VDSPRQPTAPEDVATPEPARDVITIPKSAVRQALLGVGVVIILAALVAIGIGISRLIVSQDSLASAVNHSEYQAVFLTNGQVYFGTLSAPGGDFYYLKNVYYLASRVNPQSGKATGQTLVPLGHEIHAPEDEMIINRSEILFVENLSPSGQVSRAIARATARKP
jgi:hypothetical protein